MADIAFSTGMIAVAIFCTSGTAVIDNKCEDGTFEQLTINVMNAENCKMNEAFEIDCGDFISIVEIKRNDEIIATIPSNLFTKQEMKMMYQVFMHSSK